MSEDGGDFKELGQVDAKKTKMKMKDLKTGARYVFKICAVNKVGTSKPLESDSVVPKRQPGRELCVHVCMCVVFVRVCLRACMRERERGRERVLIRVEKVKPFLVKARMGKAG